MPDAVPEAVCTLVFPVCVALSGGVIVGLKVTVGVGNIDIVALLVGIRDALNVAVFAWVLPVRVCVARPDAEAEAVLVSRREAVLDGVCLPENVSVTVFTAVFPVAVCVGASSGATSAVTVDVLV